MLQYMTGTYLCKLGHSVQACIFHTLFHQTIHYMYNVRFLIWSHRICHFQNMLCHSLRDMLDYLKNDITNVEGSRCWVWWITQVYIHNSRPNQERLQKMQHYRSSGKDRNCCYRPSIEDLRLRLAYIAQIYTWI